MEKSVSQHFDKGEVVFSEGQKGNTFYIIKSGRVEISLEQNGRKMVLGTLGAGSCFGEMAALTGERRAATATAISSTLAVEVNADYITRWGEVQDPFCALCSNHFPNGFGISTKKSANPLTTTISSSVFPPCCKSWARAWALPTAMKSRYHFMKPFPA